MTFNVSTISQALSRNVGAVNIPRPHGLGNVSIPPAVRNEDHVASGLPTPPNSISPHLTAHSLSARARKESVGSPPVHVDSDIDLQDDMDDAKSHGHMRLGSPSSGTDSSGSDAHGTITPSFLAKHYLPDIVLNNGPMPIRIVMNQLSGTVPGFADIPPAKARRIVVAGLENRQGGGEQGDIKFEKVGWGRWDAKVKGQSARRNPNTHASQRSQPSPPASASLHPQISAVKIPCGGSNFRRSRQTSHESWATEISHSQPQDRLDADGLDQDVERMSLDGEDSPSNHRKGSYNSETDEEDWARIGAAGLRASSNPTGGGFRLQHAMVHRRLRTRSPYVTLPHSHHQSQTDSSHWGSQSVEAGPEEREAAEALLRMGSL